MAVGDTVVLPLLKVELFVGAVSDLQCDIHFKTKHRILSACQ